MNNRKSIHIENLLVQNKKNKILRRAIALLSVLVLLVTTNTLKFRADTLERIPTCGFEDHVHTETCYDAEGALVCVLHEHTDACYQQRPIEEPDVDDATEIEAEGMDLGEAEVSVDAEGELTLAGIAEQSGILPEDDEPEFEGLEVESEPVEYVYELGARGPVKLSEIIEAVGLPVDFRAIEAVGPVEDTDEAVGLVGVEPVDGDYVIRALRDFPEAELAVITADNVYVVKLAFGIAPMPEPEEKVEEPVETVETVEEKTEEIEENDDNIEDKGEEAEEIVENVEEKTEEAEEIVENVEEKTEEAEEESEETKEASGETEETEKPEESEDAKDEEVKEAEDTENEEAEGAADEEAEGTEGEEAEDNADEEGEDAEEAADEEGEDAEEAADEEGEDAEEADAPRAVAAYSAEIDLSGAEVPLSMSAMMAAATPVEATEAVEPEPEEDASEASAEASEEAPAADATEWLIEYDAELLAVEPVDGDYLVTPLASFEETTVNVTAGDAVYALTLRGWVAPEPEIAMPAHTFEAEAGGVRVSVVAPEGAFPEGTTMQVADVDDADTLDSIAGTVEGEDVAVKRVHAVDITFYDAEGNEIEPMVPIAVSMSVVGVEANEDAVVVHVDNEGNTAVVEQDDAAAKAEEETTVAFTVDAFSVYAVVLTQSLETRVITADGETYRISVSYGPEAMIPEGATLRAEEISGEDEYGRYYDAAAEMLPSGESIEVARFFDITILADGEEIQPAAPVEVKVELEEPAEENVHAIHFAASGEAQVLDAGIEDEAVTFSAEGFSVYGVVYTVDFHYEVNGQTFEFSIPGGGFVSFRELMGALEIAQDDPETDADELQAFVDDVENVEFSNPELLSVSRVEADTTVGAVKDGLGLVCEYSDDLTEEDIEAINATGITAVDWALISLKPFLSEETLTVTMKNGDAFTIQITDGQIHTYVISDSGDTYKITVTYDDATGIPADAELRVRQLTPEDDRYQEDIDRSNAALLARYDQEATNPVVFDIKIFANDEEIEPIEGTQVSVEISLALDAMHGEAQGEDVEAAEDSEAAEDIAATEEAAPEEPGIMLINGVEYTPKTVEVDPTTARVVHLTDDGEAEIVEDMRSMVDADNNLVLNFETESFSDYTIQGVNNNNGLNGLPDTIYVGDEIYMQNCANMWVTGIGSVVTETKINNRDDYKSVRATNPGTFKIVYVQNTYNPGDWWNNNGKTITVLPARSEGNYPGTTPPATIQTVSNASIGMTLNLFDYDLDDYLNSRFNNYDYANGQNQNYQNNVLNDFLNHGINDGHNLKFWGSGITNGRHGNLNNYVEHGVTSIVDTNLAGGTGGYPKLKGYNETLQYLFDPSSNTSDRRVYAGADGLFKKDGDYYVYDSNQNYAWYNPDTNKFEVYDGTYKQKSRSAGGEQATQLMDKAIGFFPFHKWDSQYDLFVNWNKNLNHHFGLSMSVKFSLPKDPKAVVDTNGNPIVFEFSGDDDLWVFIDGKLAMDIGGIHQPTSGTINFQNQTVTVNGNSQNFNFNGLYDGELHTLQVFYIERGGCDSNCMIKFNLTQYGHVEFDKVDKEDTSDKLGGAIFGIYKDAACTQPLMERLKNGTSRAYVAESNASGHVKFSDIPLGDYYLKEIKAPDGYPLDSTVHPVKVYLDENSLVTVKVSIDGIDVVNPGVQIPNKKPDPINLGLKKVWEDQNGHAIPAPENTSATFELKRIRTYTTYTEELVENTDYAVSHLIVGWVHNGETHIHGEYDMIAGTQATVSWGYVDGYTGSKDCIENGTRIDKDYVSSLVVSEALTMPAEGQTATLYIIDESEYGNAIKNINVAGRQYSGNGGYGYVHNFVTTTEPDPDFQYIGDSNVVNNRITLPISGSETPWEYDFVNLPLAERTPNTATTYTYTYYLEEISNNSPEGTTVIYVDRAGNVLKAADDAETNQSGTQTITNQVDLGALELTKKITVDGQPMTEPNQWVNGTVSFTIDGVDANNSFTKGIHHDVKINYAAGKITSYKIDNTTTAVDPAVTGTTYGVLVNNLVPGDYVIKETGSSNLTLTGITGGKNDANVTEKTVTVTVTHGKNTADKLDATAKATFTNNLETIDVPATKTWADLNAGTTHPTIYFRLFYQSAEGDVAVNGVKLKPLPNGTTTVTWENVPKYDQNGQKYVYLVREYIQKDGGEFTEDGTSYTEAAPNGYVATEEGLSVTNTESDKYDPRTSYTGRKVWVDPTNNTAVRPDNLTVTLMIDRTGNGPSDDDVVAKHDSTPYTPVWNKPEGSNEWTYTFNNLPVYDADWNIIHYYAVETPVNGYEQGNATITPTTYVYKNNYTAQHIPNDTDVTISSEINLLPFMAIQTKDTAYEKTYHIWTVRVATDAEKAELVRIFNAEIGGRNVTVDNTRFVSGLPVSKTSDGNVEYLYKSNAYKISISKSSGDVLKVVVDGSRYMQDMIVGTLEYDYSAGSTDLQNTLKTEDYDVKKTWGSNQLPPEGAEVQFTLTATIPGTSTDENSNPDPVTIADLTTLGIAKPVVTLNGGQKEGEEYTGDDTTEAPWVYKWENLPQYDKNGNKITYSASETSYTIDGETVDITSDGLVPPTANDEIYELITTNRIPTEHISAHKYWPEGQTVPEGTQIKLAITAKLESGADPKGVTVTPATVTLDGKVTAGDANEVETADTLWAYTWQNLPKYDKDGKKIIYTVEETEYKIGDIPYADLLAAPNDPPHEGVDFSFTNELPGTRITVEKTWSNNGGSWPDGVSVIMTLKGSAPIGENGAQQELETLVIPDYQDGEQTAEYALSGDETSHTWYNLPMYTKTGKPITYTVDETGMTYTYTPEGGGQPVTVPIQNWAQAFTTKESEDAENNKITIDNTPLETEISLTKVWTLNGQPKPMKDGDSISFKLYRTDEEGELTLSADGYAANKGTATLNQILYVGSGDNLGWQTVTISKLPKYVLKLEDTGDGVRVYYTGVAYYAVETSVTGNTRISYTLSPMNASASSGSDGGEGGEGSGNTETAGPTETTDPTQSAIGTGTITIYNRDTNVDIKVLKVDATDEDKKLPNAEFQILKWKEGGGPYPYYAYNLETQTFAASNEEANSKLTTGSDGCLVFEDLLDGKYKVVETKSPDGYIKVDVGDIFFKIEDGEVTWTDEDGNAIGEGNKRGHVAYDDLTFTVENTPGAKLPSTGGPGTWAYTLSGMALMAFAMVMLIKRARARDVR